MPARGEEDTPNLRNNCAPAESNQTPRSTSGNPKGSLTETPKRTHESFGLKPDNAEIGPPEKKQKEAEPCVGSAKEPLTQTNAKTNEDAAFGSTAVDTTTNVTHEPVETVDEVILRVSGETTKLLTKFQEHFSESEGFELFCPARLDQLLKQARSLEENYMDQRKKLRERLTRTLQML
eukprot:Em0004g1686a